MEDILRSCDVVSACCSQVDFGCEIPSGTLFGQLRPQRYGNRLVWKRACGLFSTMQVGCFAKRNGKYRSFILYFPFDAFNTCSRSVRNQVSLVYFLQYIIFGKRSGDKLFIHIEHAELVFFHLVILGRVVCGN